jgi:hypothetical protein
MTDDWPIEHGERELVIRSENTFRRFGWIAIVISIVILFFLLKINVGPGEHAGIWIGLLVGFGFFAFGCLFLLPQRTTTIFDLRAREVRRTIAVANRFEFRRVIPFADISSIGFDAPDEAGYNAVVRLKTGRVVSIAAETRFEIERALIDQIAAATGLKAWNTGDKNSA